MIDKKKDEGNVNNSSEVEILKIQSEIEKNRSESKKNSLEALIIKRRLGKRWYLADFAFKIIIGTIVTSALLVTWLIAYLHPILKVDQEISEKEIRKNKIQIQIDKNQNILETKKLKRDQSKLTTRHNVLKQAYKKLEQQNKRLIEGQKTRKIRLIEGQKTRKIELAKLKNKYTKALENIKTSDSNNLKALVSNLKDEINTIKDENVKIDEELKVSKAQSQSIMQEIKIVNKINSNVYIYYKNHEEKAIEIKHILNEAGYINTTNPFQADAVPNKTQVRYFRENEKEKQEAKFISDALLSLGISAEAKHFKIPFHKRLFLEDRHYEIWIGKKLSQD